MIRKALSSAMMIVGIGLVVFAFSDYAPAGSDQFAGWSDACRYVMTAGAMLATGGRLLL